MQTAYLAADLLALRRGLREVPGLSRIYFGHETCPWRFPSEKDVAEARGVAEGEGLGFTLVTPPIHQAHLDGFLQRLARFRPSLGDEIVFNDLGLLFAAASSGHAAAPVMGRLLLPLPNDPQMAAAARANPGTSAIGLAADPSIPKALLTLGVVRRDLDSPWAAVAAPEGHPVPFSLHRPWGVLTVTRLCPWARTMSGWGNLTGCAAPCRGHHLRLAGDEEPEREAVIAGNAWYALLPEPSAPLPSIVDRLVLQDPLLLG
jgi:hypothetical protein